MNTNQKDNSATKAHTTTHHYFIKGDVSGIQDFIFNVKSEKAARVLKARSVTIELITDFAVEYLKKQLSNTELLFNGGGNFYLWADLENEGVIDALQRKLNAFTYQQDFILVLSACKVHSSFNDVWEKVNSLSNFDKQKIFRDEYNLFEPYENPVERKYAGKARSIADLDITQQFAVHFPKKVALLTDEFEASGFEQDIYSLAFLNRSLRLSSAKKLNNINEFSDRITQLLPTLKGFKRSNSEPSIKKVYREQLEKIHSEEEQAIPNINSVIEFELLAYFAGERTGTEKLGILKMDVDNLGKLFSKITDKEIVKKRSKDLQAFFDVKLVDYLNEELPNHILPKGYKEEGRAYKFGDNIYTIFAGGDDCFFVGAWDAILEWAWKINDNFKDFVEINNIKHDDSSIATISAGICIIHSKYPVVRFAEIADEALSNAKNAKHKNSVCVFNEVLSWKEFEDAKYLSYMLVNAVEEDREIRALLNKIQSAAKQFRIQHDEASQGKISLPSIWKLFYMGRNRFGKGRGEPNLKEQEESIESVTTKNAITSLINNYYLSLMKVFMQKESVNPMKYPVIARWTELLTRKNKVHESESQDN